MKMVYLLVQEHKEDGNKLLSLLLSIKVSDPTSHVDVYCTDACKAYMKSFDSYDPTAAEKGIETHENVSYYNIKDNLWIETYANNLLTALQSSLDRHGEVIFVHHYLIMMRPIVIEEQVKEQGFGFLNKAFKIAKDHKQGKYSFDVMYVNRNGQAHIDKMRSEYAKKTALNDELIQKIEDGTEYELEKEEKMAFVTIWKELPQELVEYDDGFAHVEYCIDGGQYCATENYFAFEEKWKLNELDMKDLKYNEKGITLLNIRFDSFEGTVQQLGKRLLNMLVMHDKRYMTICNMKYCKGGEQDMIVPLKDGIAHWDRNQDQKMYRLIDGICEGSQHLKSTEMRGSDYFLFNNYVLFDKPDEKWVTNACLKSYAILLFDYSDGLLATLRSGRHPVRFFGFAVPYPTLLEEEELFDDSVERNQNVYEFNEQDLPLNEDDYKLYLNELKTHASARFNAKTPKHHFAECMRLGVVPVISEDFEVLDLKRGENYIMPDVGEASPNTKSLWADEIATIRDNNKQLFNSNYSIDALRRRVFAQCLTPGF